MQPLKLITEADSANYDLQYVYEQTDKNSERRMIIEGVYLLQNTKNKNNRIYDADEMEPAVAKFNENYVERNRACGTLNHETSPDIDLSKICHRIISLKQEGNTYIGRSMVSSTPSGRILSQLLEDKFAIGMSSRSLGTLTESSGSTKVKNLAILSVDAVYEPSTGGSLNNPDTGFVKGVLENREFIIGNDARAYEAFSKFNKHLSKYPSHHSDAIKQHILEGFQKLLKSL
jgi:hypothetical protein